MLIICVYLRSFAEKIVFSGSLLMAVYPRSLKMIQSLFLASRAQQPSGIAPYVLNVDFHSVQCAALIAPYETAFLRCLRPSRLNSLLSVCYQYILPIRLNMSNVAFGSRTPCQRIFTTEQMRHIRDRRTSETPLDSGAELHNV